MFLDCGFIRSKVNAIHLVARDVAVKPLDLRTHRSENANRLLGNLAQLSVGQISSTGNFTFDDEFGHARTPNEQRWARMLACRRSSFKARWLRLETQIGRDIEFMR
jgi:hypothetical protein